MRSRSQIIVLVCALPAIAAAQVVVSSSDSAPSAPRPDATLRLLNTRIPEIDFRETPLGSALEVITAFFDGNVVIRWQELSSAGIADDKPISMRLRNCTLSYALWLVLSEAGGADALLAYRASANTLLISTDADLGREMITKVYDVSDLLISARRFSNAPRLDTSAISSGGSGAGASALQPVEDNASDAAPADQTRVAELAELIRNTVEPDSWVENGGQGRIAVWQNSLVIHNKLAVHQAIAGYRTTD
ncbi:MAG: hypothetical protein JNG88_09865 [Phycisphaerales bacterium]|nr:hypothetical protein [Phycisphaerales bacterium]